MHAAGEVLWSFQFGLDECLVDDDLRGDVGQLASLPGFHLLSHGLEVSLHSINTHRDAVDERERLRVFGKYGSEHARDNVPKSLNSVCRGVQLPRANLWFGITSGWPRDPGVTRRKRPVVVSRSLRPPYIIHCREGDCSPNRLTRFLASLTCWPARLSAAIPIRMTRRACP